MTDTPYTVEDGYVSPPAGRLPWACGDTTGACVPARIRAVLAAAEEGRANPADALRDALRRNPPPFGAAAAEEGTDA